ncbi:MAG: phage terminase large subunit [Bacteroidia bacterium]|nr:phage terminase large subunit [Bacteroidia bacterium]
MAKKETQEYRDFLKLCEQIKNSTHVKKESEAEKKYRIDTLLSDYNQFCKYYFPDFASVDCAKFHIEACRYVTHHHRCSVIFRWHRGAAKSMHACVFLPLWLMAKSELKFGVIVGNNLNSAKRLLGDLQAQLMENQRIINDFGEQFKQGDWQEGEFTTQSGVTFVALGMGQSPRGLRRGKHRPDYIVCDDVDTAELSRNKSRIQDAVQWVLQDLMGCFDIGNARFILAGNLFAKNSINAILEQKGFKVILANALDAKGKPTWKEKYTAAYFNDIKARIGTKEFLREYQNEPIEEGKVFQPEWIKFESLPADFFQKAKLIIYCDPSFSAKGDYKAVKLWGRYGLRYYCLKAFVQQTTLKKMIETLYQWHEQYPTAEIWIEEQFVQEFIMQEVQRIAQEKGYFLPIRRDKRKKPNKLQRIEALTPLYENGLIIYDITQKNDPDMQRSIEQTLLFEEGSSVNDDAPDADEGAIYLLQKYSSAIIPSKKLFKTIERRAF